MLAEIIIGAVVGGGLLTAWTIWYTQKMRIQEENQREEEESSPRRITDYTLLLDLPIEKKLRNALYECERGEEECVREIEQILLMQSDLLEGIGKPSYVEVRGKPIYFIWQDPINNEKRFYYSRDLNKVEPEILTETQKILLHYKEHIDLFVDKLNLFGQLKKSHQENLNRIQGIQQQHEQISKLKKHQNKIAEMDEKSDIEAKILKNENLIENIERELDYQSECLEQYVQLTTQLDQPLDKKVDKELKGKIQDLIKKLEQEDPDKRDKI